jgi:undecaprenyl-diphosphatase
MLSTEGDVDAAGRSCDHRSMGADRSDPSRRGLRVAAIIGSWVVVAVLAVAVLLDPGPLPGDLPIVRWFQARPEPIPTIAEAVRLTTSTEAALLVALLPAMWIVRRDHRRGAIAITIALVTMLVTQPMIKELIDRPRPSAELVDVRAEYSSKSFPSGHSMSTATVWGAAALVAARRRRYVLCAGLCAPIALTACASLVQGVHWPSDSLAGLLIGGTAGYWVATVLLRPGLGPR